VLTNWSALKASVQNKSTWHIVRCSLQALCHCPADSCTSSNCRSTNQISLKGPALWHSVTIWPTTAVCCEDRREAVYTLRLPLWDDCVHCFLSVTPTRFYPEIKTHMSAQNTYLKNRPRGATHLHYIIHFYKIHLQCWNTFCNDKVNTSLVQQ
jgi:hypothetical protein